MVPNVRAQKRTARPKNRKTTPASQPRALEKKTRAREKKTRARERRKVPTKTKKGRPKEKIFWKKVNDAVASRNNHVTLLNRSVSTVNARLSSPKPYGQTPSKEPLLYFFRMHLVLVICVIVESNLSLVCRTSCLAQVLARVRGEETFVSKLEILQIRVVLSMTTDAHPPN